jgi:hypothetical protein
MEKPHFSKRHGYSGSEVEITIREDAPDFLRYSITGWAAEAGMSAHTRRDIVCDILRNVPNSDNWSDGNVSMEADYLVAKCPWYRVYDIVEAFSRWIAKSRDSKALNAFTDSVNQYFREEGVGWKLEASSVISRGEEGFEAVARASLHALSESRQRTAKQELQQAMIDLSRRPDADLTGAIQHAMAAMECVAREFCGEPQPTFGKLLERYPELVPRPLNQGVEKAWGYASEMGRHLREGRVPEREEAELVVSIAASISTYLIGKRTRKEGGMV